MLKKLILITGDKNTNPKRMNMAKIRWFKICTKHNIEFTALGVLLVKRVIIWLVFVLIKKLYSWDIIFLNKSILNSIPAE